MRLVEGIAEAESVDGFVDALDGVGDEHDVTVQAFDARYVVSRRHLARALELADRERARGNAIARERAVEVLLYAAGRRQIDRALELGVDAGETPVVVVVAGRGAHPSEDAATVDGTGSDERAPSSDDEGPADDDSRRTGDEEAAAEAVADLLEPAETLGEYDEERVRAFFDVGDRELAATDATLEELVLERVALLVVNR